MHPLNEHLRAFTRRQLFQRLGSGIGALALTTLLEPELFAQAQPPNGSLVPRRPHFAPRARSVIYLHMVGAPSHLDLFDHKPALQRHNGELVPQHLIEGQRFAFLRGRPRLLGTRFRFARHGRGGLELSELLPHLAGVADEITVVKTLHTEEFNHAPAQLFLHTGFGQFGRPSIGSWVAYGLGTENQDMPAFVVLITGRTAGAGNSLWGAGFLPTVYQGVQFRSTGDPVLFLSNPPGITPQDRRNLLDGVRDLNRVQLADVGDPEIATRIEQYELAYRMQTAVPELTDIAREPRSVHEMYGTTPGRPSFANHCLLARRLVERGVRFVQLYDADWDHHNNVFANLPRKCREVDRPIAALVKDLRQRGLLDQTLVIWGGEFGRTPMMQGESSDLAGRDHHKDAFSVWLAGGGVKGGFAFGRTDELGYFPVEHPLHVRDFHATILHLLGLDHQRLTFRFQGRPYRLTDIGGRVIDGILT
ncbi:MAG: DUF1501 domain-containing protein [Gemmataceae bacterium]|nr:DUF1501 domain-containing protein [Gemmataceae bacterium]